MDRKQIITDYWLQFAQQNWDSLSSYFLAEAKISWPNTAEEFKVDEFINVNRYYPGNWSIEIVALYEFNELLISITRIFNESAGWRAVSFFSFCADKINYLQEYFCEDSSPPSWRAAVLKNE